MPNNILPFFLPFSFLHQCLILMDLKSSSTSSILRFWLLPMFFFLEAFIFLLFLTCDYLYFFLNAQGNFLVSYAETFLMSFYLSLSPCFASVCYYRLTAVLLIPNLDSHVHYLLINTYIKYTKGGRLEESLKWVEIPLCYHPNPHELHISCFLAIYI